MGSHVLFARLLDAVPAPVAARFEASGRPARLLRPLVNRLLSDGQRAMTVRSGPAAGIKLVINPRTEKYYWTGTYERSVQEALRAALRPGAIFWDVGAHIGFFSLLASRLVGDRGEVHAFEPAETSRARLSAAVDLNDARNVVIHSSAIAERTGERALHAHERSSMWTLVPERGDHVASVVHCCTLDEVAQRLELSPGVIKIDVEGAEVDVLRGGLGLLASSSPVLLVEFSDDATLAEARNLLPGWTFERLDTAQWLLTRS